MRLELGGGQKRTRGALQIACPENVVDPRLEAGRLRSPPENRRIESCHHGGNPRRISPVGKQALKLRSVNKSTCHGEPSLSDQVGPRGEARRFRIPPQERAIQFRHEAVQTERASHPEF